jgi:hypothetical protein
MFATKRFALNSSGTAACGTRYSVVSFVGKLFTLLLGVFRSRLPVLFWFSLKYFAMGSNQALDPLSYFGLSLLKDLPGNSCLFVTKEGFQRFSHGVGQRPTSSVETYEPAPWPIFIECTTSSVQFVVSPIY